MSKEANRARPNRDVRGKLLAVVVSPAGLFLMVVLVLGLVFVAVYPIYPRITGVIQTSVGEPRFSLVGSPKLDRLTLAQASSIQKGQVFLYPGQITPQTKFTLTIQVYYGRDKIMPDQIFKDREIGQYYFTVVLNPKIEQQNALYHLDFAAQFTDGTIVRISSIVIPA